MISVLIVYASFGEGHKRAAEAIGDFFEAPVCDLLDFAHPFVRQTYRKGYLFITQHLPTLWSFIFLITRIKFVAKTSHYLQQFLLPSFFIYLKNNNPELIITTHFSASHIIAIAKKDIRGYLVAVVTDIRAHPLWADEAIDKYFVFSDITKKDLVKVGVKEERVLSGYVSLRKGFVEESDINMLYDKFLLPVRPTILFASSRRGTFPYLKLSLKKLLEEFNVIVIYGNNEKLKKYLESVDSKNLKYFSFDDSIWELVTLSCVIIGKPCGLTIFEGIFKKKPFVFTHFIPGQEVQNMDFLREYDVACYVKNASEFIAAIRYFYKKFTEARCNYPIVVEDIRKPLLEIANKISSSGKQ